MFNKGNKEELYNDKASSFYIFESYTMVVGSFGQTNAKTVKLMATTLKRYRKNFHDYIKK